MPNPYPKVAYAPPRCHVARYFGVLSSHSALRRFIVPTAAPPGDLAAAPAEPDGSDAVTAPNPAPKSKYIPWHELLRRTFGIDVVCSRCHGSLRLIALVKEAATIAKILAAKGLDTTHPHLASARGTATSCAARLVQLRSRAQGCLLPPWAQPCPQAENAAFAPFPPHAMKVGTLRRRRPERKETKHRIARGGS